MPEKTLVLNSCIFLVKHVVAKTIEQLQQHLKKSYGTINSGFPEPSPANVPASPPPPPPGTEAGTGGATGAHNPERITHATAFSQTSIFLDRFSAILTIK